MHIPYINSKSAWWILFPLPLEHIQHRSHFMSNFIRNPRGSTIPVLHANGCCKRSENTSGFSYCCTKTFWVNETYHSLTWTFRRFEWAGFPECHSSSFPWGNTVRSWSNLPRTFLPKSCQNLWLNIFFCISTIKLWLVTTLLLLTVWVNYDTSLIWDRANLK